MKILDPVTEIPRRSSKYTLVMNAVVAAAGVWVPVEMETPREARKLHNSMRQKRGFESRSRDAIVYIRAVVKGGIKP